MKMSSCNIPLAPILAAGLVTGVFSSILPSVAIASGVSSDQISERQSHLKQRLDRADLKLRVVVANASGLVSLTRDDLMRELQALREDPSDAGLTRFCRSVHVDADAHDEPFGRAAVTYANGDISELLSFEVLDTAGPKIIETHSIYHDGQLTEITQPTQHLQATVKKGSASQLISAMNKVVLLGGIPSEVTFAESHDNFLVGEIVRGALRIRWSWDPKWETVVDRSVYAGPDERDLQKQRVQWGRHDDFADVSLPEMTATVEYQSGLVASLSLYMIDSIRLHENVDLFSHIAVSVPAGTVLVDASGTDGAAEARLLGQLRVASADVTQALADARSAVGVESDSRRARQGPSVAIGAWGWRRIAFVTANVVGVCAMGLLLYRRMY